MLTLNRDALTLPADRLLDALQERIARKQAALDQRKRANRDRYVWVGSYMENIGYPELFGYDMNRYFTDPAFAIETELRQRIFWADNVISDDVPGTGLTATTGMYFDITLFGQKVWHTPIGVPEFSPHPISQKPDLSLLPPVDFHTSGEMPQLLATYKEMQRLAKERYGGKLTIGFPTFDRGPLDIYVQLRGYEGFVEDTFERPEFAHAFLNRVVDDRLLWSRARRRMLGEPEFATSIRLADDWVNIPFITPEMFTEYVAPVYRRIIAEDGKVNWYHTCGVMAPVSRKLYGILSDISMIEIQGWDNLDLLDRTLDPKIGFAIAFKNAFTLMGTEAQQREHLEFVARIHQRRRVALTPGAIVKLHPTYEENLERLNGFIALAREVLGQK